MKSLQFQNFLKTRPLLIQHYKQKGLSPTEVIKEIRKNFQEELDAKKFKQENLKQRIADYKAAQMDMFLQEEQLLNSNKKSKKKSKKKKKKSNKEKKS